MLEHPDILVIEDEPVVQELLKKYLESSYNLSIASTLNKANDYLSLKKFDLIILDLNISGESGFNLLKDQKFRKYDIHALNVIVLTSHDDIDSQIEGHTLGVKDYLVKPVKKDLLLSVVEKNLYAKSNIAGSIKLNEVSLDFKASSLFIETKDKIEGIKLSSKQFMIMQCLMKHAGMIMSRSQIIEYINSGSISSCNERTIDVHINHIRKSHKILYDYISTIHGIGYLFQNRNKI